MAENLVERLRAKKIHMSYGLDRVEHKLPASDLELEAAAAIEQLQRDANRYRFLKDNHVRLWSGLRGKCDSLDLDFEGKGDDLDAAVDAAIAKAEGRS